MQFLLFLLHISQNLGAAIEHYGAWVYALMFAIVFCETAFLPLFFLPGDPLLFVGGAFCAQGALHAGALALALTIAAVLGCTINYGIGRAVGHRLATREYAWVNREALNRTHAFFEKYGGVTLVLSPFIAVVRTFAPFVAGISAMSFGKFQAFNVAGAVVWVVSLETAGYFFGQIPIIHDHLNAIVLCGVGIGVGILLLGGIRKWAAS